VKLRPYQLQAEESAFQAWSDGSRSVLGVLPTGTGKTVLFASIIRRKLPLRTMVIAHRQELIWQARDKIQRVTGLEVDVEMGEYKAAIDGNLFHPRASVIVSTVQTHIAGGDGGGRIGKFDPKDFGLLVIDEAHHATSGSYRRIIDYYMTNPDLVVLGVTATPDRADEEALGQVFESVGFDYEVLDAIKDGWLVPIEQQFVSVESLDFSSVKTQAGDLNGTDLNAVMTAEKNLHGIASSTIDMIGDRRGIGFAASVEHAHKLSEIFNRHKYGLSNVVSHKTEKEERKKIISDFACGKIQWLWNCGVFTEGFDDSGVEVISMARPTKSRALYAQMAGRGTRPLESIAHRLGDTPNATLRRALIARSAKPTCLIVDFVGNSGKHKLMTTADILGGNISEEAIAAAISTAMRAGRPVRMGKELEEEEKRQEEMKKKKLAEEGRRARLVAKSSYKTQTVDPFDILAIKPVAAKGWDQGKQLSEAQKGILRKAGYNPEGMEYGRAKQLVGIMIDRWKNGKCSINQAKTLEKFGYEKTEASAMSFEDASKAIDAIAKNGWKRPLASMAPVSSPESSPALESDEVPF